MTGENTTLCLPNHCCQPLEEDPAINQRRPKRRLVSFDATDMKQIGFMLSLRLADGSPNPVATFGQGIFDFSLDVASIEPIFGEKINKDDAKEL